MGIIWNIGSSSDLDKIPEEELVLTFIIFIIFKIVLSIKYNENYIIRLIQKGYEPCDEISESYLIHMGIIDNDKKKKK